MKVVSVIDYRWAGGPGHIVNLKRGVEKEVPDGVGKLMLADPLIVLAEAKAEAEAPAKAPASRAKPSAKAAE